MTDNSADITHFREFIDTDDALFHYSKRNTALEKILSQNCFKLFRLLDTNDPKEYKARLLGVSGWNWSNDTEPLIHEAHNHSDALLRKHSYFCSVTENKFSVNKLHSHGYLKPRMWAQYGEDHYGVCLIFSKQKLINAISDSIDKNKFCIFYDSISYRNVEYNSRSRTLSINGDSFNNKTPFQIAFEHIKNHYNDLFFMKDPDYKDENEFRIVVCRSTENSKEFHSIDVPLKKASPDVSVGSG